MTSTKRRGAIIVNAFWRGGDAGAEKIAAALSSFGYSAPLIRGDEIGLTVGKGLLGSVSFDFAVFLDKDDHLARLLELANVRLFNRAEAIRLSDDKMLTHIALAPFLPQPETVSSPLFFAGEDDPDLLRTIEEKLGYPVVVKKCFGAFGKQVFLAKNREELAALRRDLIKEPHIYQKYIECGATDYRVITIGGEAVAAMKRNAVTPGEFRANAELGGRGEAIALTPDLKEIAETASRVLGLEYAGVDLLWDGERHLVTEVNSNAHFKLIEEVTGVPIATLYAQYIAKTIEKGEKI